MKVIYSTRHGCGKAESEDAILINDNVFYDEIGNMELNEFSKIAIVDGVGGNKGGKDAALFILRKAAELHVDTEVELRKKLIKINQQLIDYANDMGDKNKMATTFTALFNCNNYKYLIHIGNTRLYIKQGSYLRQVTHDHTTYQFMIDRGMEETADACNKNEIQACFGGGMESYLKWLTVESVFLERIPKRIIFTSDGIHEYVSVESIEKYLIRTSDIEEGIKQLNIQAIDNGSKDDRTVLVIDFN